MKSIRLTVKRLEIIIDALAYWETVLEDGSGTHYETEGEYQRLEHERSQAFVWAHQQLAKRKSQEIG